MLTWEDARNSIIEHTEIGYTLKSQDRLWVAATVEDRTDTWCYLVGNSVFATVKRTEQGGLIASYDLWDDVAVFLSRREVEAFIATLGRSADVYHPLNLGDDARFEKAYFDRKIPGLSGAGYEPKFKGSRGYFELRQKVWATKPTSCVCGGCEEGYL